MENELTREREMFFSELDAEPSRSLFQNASIVDIARGWARARPDHPAYTYFADGAETTLTFAELDQRALTIASKLQENGWQGERMLLIYATGLEFVGAFFGCLYAGAIAVPVPPGRGKSSRARLSAIVRDCEPRAVLTTSTADGALFERPEESAAHPLAALARIDTDRLAPSSVLPLDRLAHHSSGLAFLQYTSGSTSEPKGTAVSHANILANQRMLQEAYGTGDETVVVSWLPLFHDMGLVGMMLHGAYLGVRVVLLSTLAVMKQPLSWLRAFGRFRGTFSAAPNFAFDLCVARSTDAEREQLDLGSWEVAVNGSEPVRHATLQRFVEAFEPAGFRATSLAPSYGLAEATLVVSGSRGRLPVFLEVEGRRLQADEIAPKASTEDVHVLVGCGRFDLGDQTLRIVDPNSCRVCSPGEVGEIWLAGAHVAQGYYRKPEVTAERFEARLPADPRRYLRTGDLGFVRDSELFITGRIKDLIVFRGQKFYPQDIELTTEGASSLVRRGSVAAFGVELGTDSALVVVAEVERRESATRELAARLALEIRRFHELPLLHVVLVGKKAVPKTTSGKIQRHRCRKDYLEAEVSACSEWVEPRLRLEPAALSLLESRIEAYARRWLREVMKVEPPADAVDEPFAALGLDSIMRVRLFQAIEKHFDTVIPDATAHGLESIRELARFACYPPSAERAVPAERSESTASEQTRSDIVFPSFTASSREPRR